MFEADDEVEDEARDIVIYLRASSDVVSHCSLYPHYVNDRE